MGKDYRCSESMYSFKNDYSEGAHPIIMEKLMSTNLEQTEGYSLDEYTQKVINKIQQVTSPNADVHILVGGTQTNLTAISAFLRPHHAVIAAESGHINVHETGAIEATGHKVVTAKTKNGKLSVELIDSIVTYHTDEHMVKPKMVYLSNPTEVGTLYDKKELVAIRQYCRDNNLYLYLDGARMASALAAEGNDLTLADYAELTDAFYIGGTKCGAMFGEALVIVKDELKEDFRYHIKQRGGMFAKGRLLAIQFDTLFENNMYEKIGMYANCLAKRLHDGLAEMGVSFLYESKTNQQFPILPNTVIEQLEKQYAFHVWEPATGDNSVIRLVTSWATVEEKVEAFLKDVAYYLSQMEG